MSFLRTCLEVLRSMGNPTGERASRAGLKCNSKSTSEPHGRAYRLKHSAVGYGTDIKAIHYERSVVYILYTEKHIGQHVLVFAYVHMYLYRGC